MPGPQIQVAAPFGAVDLFTFFQNTQIPAYQDGEFALIDNVDGWRVTFGSYFDDHEFQSPNIEEIIRGVTVQNFTLIDISTGFALLQYSGSALQVGEFIDALAQFKGQPDNHFQISQAFTGFTPIQFNGSPLADTFEGGNGDDTLFGQGGADVLRGGAGSDTYFIDRQFGDTTTTSVVETPFNGVDTVQVNYDYALPDNVENLTLDGGAAQGTGNELDNVIHGGFQDNMLIGLDGGDVLYGEVGVDTLYGGNGGDSLFGGGQDDVLYAGNGNDTANGEDGFDLIFGGGGNDTLNGGALSDEIHGDDGDDIIDGGAGIDTMIGGFGADTYYVDETTDIIVEDDLPAPPITFTVVKGSDVPVYNVSGYDRVYSTATYTLSPNIEFLQLLTKKSIDGTGNDQDNLILGNVANNVIRGMGGDDVLDGMGDGDTLYGGTGDDIIFVHDRFDTVIEYADEGHDLVKSWVTYALTDNVEDLDLLGTDAIDGTGNALDNRIDGNSGANVLNGKDGDDQMAGGAGNDTYIIDSLGDVATEFGAQGTDTIVTPFTTTLGDYFENLTLTGLDAVDGTGNASANVILGNGLDNVLNGLTGADTMAGGRGDDSYYVDNVGDLVTEGAGPAQGHDTVYSTISYILGLNVEDLTLIGSANINGAGNDQDNLIIGNGGANVIDGAHGADEMRGMGGNDTYFVDSTGDVVVEGFNQGTDNVRAIITYVLTVNVENLTLTGAQAIDGTGNTLNNTITGNANNNVLDGGNSRGEVDLPSVATDGFGEGGGATNDLIKGPPIILIGHDTLIGGLGDDTYIIRRASDVVIEKLGEGTDTALTQVSYTLASNVENLVLTGEAGINGTGNALGNVITGNANANVLDGGLGADTLIGGLGDDIYIVDNLGDVVVEGPGGGTDIVYASVGFSLSANVENLTLTGFANLAGIGNGLDNELFGNPGNNVLDGGQGGDIMTGGLGNDIFYVDNAGDQVFEEAGQGVDTVVSSIDFVLSDEVEKLVLTGTAVNGTGNDLNNTLNGNAANNTLDGGLGVDIMAGGLGADTYRVDNIGDVVQEVVGGGNDLVYTTLNTYVTPANVEQLVFQGVGDFNGSGTNDNNKIYAGIGNDTLDGKGGADTMTGFTGDDTYYVDNAGDVVVEAANGGDDTVIATIAYTLGADVENLIAGGASSIAQTGNGLDNEITGNAGNNVMNGLGGADLLSGKAGNDTLNGGAGDDLLIGGAGTDQLTGGTGADTFLFSSLADFPAGPAFDVITDFSHAQGDVIDLQFMDADTTTAGNQGFHFLGTGAFTHTAGELRYATIGNAVLLGGDVNGDGVADFFIKLMGITSISGVDLHP